MYLNYHISSPSSLHTIKTKVKNYKMPVNYKTFKEITNCKVQATKTILLSLALILHEKKGKGL